MRQIHHAFAFWAMLVSGTVVIAQDKPQAVVEKAIQAQGGQAKVAKLRTMRIKVEGTTDLVSGQPELPFTIEDTWQMPNRIQKLIRF